ncbi:Na(+) H(+) antiporter subunit C [Geomicrobium sp. JCM 19038]|nr:Na(+) H(+) antiporter subunit C [Geomicrobium sp. JCM 19038]
MGLLLLSHGAHLLLLTMAGLKQGMPALVDRYDQAFTDPLPQALILTAIVISFGMTSFSLAIAYRTYKFHKTDNLDELRGSNDD